MTEPKTPLQRALRYIRGEGWTVRKDGELYVVSQLADRRLMSRAELLDFAGISEQGAAPEPPLDVLAAGARLIGYALVEKRRTCVHLQCLDVVYQDAKVGEWEIVIRYVGGDRQFTLEGEAP